MAGQIEYGEFLNLDGLACKYAFVAGDDWQTASGMEEGHGQFSFKSTNSAISGKRMVWNLPYEIEFRSMTPTGWPQFVVYCIGKSDTGKEFVKAYGSVHVPISPGVHKKSIRMYCPIETKGIWEYFGWNREGEGLSTLINNPKAIASPDGREVSRVMATGTLHVTM